MVGRLGEKIGSFAGDLWPQAARDDAATPPPHMLKERSSVSLRCVSMNQSLPNTASVLVVEDEPILRLYVSDVLDQSGFDVVAVSSGEEALSRLEQGGLCAVVSDVVVPGSIDGFELARRVRSECPRMGVVLVSGATEPSQLPLPVGVRFISKPVKASTLLRLVREVADPRAHLPAA